MADVAAIILCGGASRRMGSSKADLPFGGETLLQRSVRLLLEVARPVVVAAAPEQAMPAFSTPPLVARDPSGRLGPLQGFATGLTALGPEVELVYLATVDAPFFEARRLTLLSEALDNWDAVATRIDDRIDPLNALYRAAPARVAVHDLLGRGERRASMLVQALTCRILSAADLQRAGTGVGMIDNLNTPEDYRRALDRLSRPENLGSETGEKSRPHRPK